MQLDLSPYCVASVASKDTASFHFLAAALVADDGHVLASFDRVFASPGSLTDIVRMRVGGFCGDVVATSPASFTIEPFVLYQAMAEDVSAPRDLTLHVAFESTRVLYNRARRTLASPNTIIFPSRLAGSDFEKEIAQQEKYVCASAMLTATVLARKATGVLVALFPVRKASLLQHKHHALLQLGAKVSRKDAVDNNKALPYTKNLKVKGKAVPKAQAVMRHLFDAYQGNANDLVETGIRSGLDLYLC